MKTSEELNDELMEKVNNDTLENREFIKENIGKIPSVAPLWDKMIMERLHLLEENQKIMLEEISELQLER